MQSSALSTTLSSTLSTTIQHSVTPTINLPDGQRVEVEFDADDDSVEIRCVESNGGVSGSVFVPLESVPGLLAELKRITDQA